MKEWTPKTIRRLVILWAFFVVMFPQWADKQGTSGSDSSQQSGEGLYKAKTTNANFGLLGVRYYESANGRRHWHIQSKFAELHRKDNYAFLQEVMAEFFAERTGNVVVTHSDYGRSWTDKNLIELEGNVSIESKRGYLFTMDKMNYHSQNHEFTSDETVNMRGPDVDKPAMFLKGVGLHADIDREHFFLKKNVSAQRRLKDSGWLRITSKSGQFFTDESRAVFINKAHGEMPGTSIECDVMEISMDEEGETMSAQGKVTLRNKDRVGYAESALIQLGGNEIVLEGRAKIESRGNRIEGRKIRLYSDDDRIDVEQASGKVSDDSPRR